MPAAHRLASLALAAGALLAGFPAAAAAAQAEIDAEAAKAARAQVMAAMSRARMNVYTGTRYEGLGAAVRTSETGPCSIETVFRHEGTGYEFKHGRDWTKGGIANGKIILIDSNREEDRYVKFDSPADEAAAVKAVEELSAVCNGKREKPKETGLKSITVLFPPGNNYTNGYIEAKAEVKYRFIPCFGELHVAYSLVSDSVTTNDQYTYNRKGLRAEGVPPPKLSAIHLNAAIFKRDTVGFRKIGWVSDKFAGPALGMGCFSGQLKKVGNLSEHVPKGMTTAEVQAYLDENFELGEGRALSEGPLRNAAVESRTDAEWDRLGVDKALRENDANWAEIKAKADAELAERKAARAQYESDRARFEEARRATEAAKQQFDRDKAAHEAELARAKAAREDYERKLAEWKAQTGNN